MGQSQTNPGCTSPNDNHTPKHHFQLNRPGGGLEVAPEPWESYMQGPQSVTHDVEEPAGTAAEWRAASSGQTPKHTRLLPTNTLKQLFI